MKTVSVAKRYGDMGSLGNASNKFIRQFNFPFKYRNDEVVHCVDHDRIAQQKLSDFNDVCKKHCQGRGFSGWVQEGPAEEVLEFLKEVMGLVDDSDNKWTGFRVTGTVNRSNGFPVYSISLFAKNPKSATKVYSDDNAPNVEPWHRRRRTNVHLICDEYVEVNEPEKM